MCSAKAERKTGKPRKWFAPQKFPKENGQQPEEKKTPPTQISGKSALTDLRLFTPVFPIQARKKLMYYEPSLTLTGTAGVLAQYVFSANGAYDPNISGGGHQPMGWDEMMKYYEQGTVVASKITVRGCGNGAQAVNLAVSLAPDTSTSVVPDLVENGLIVPIILDGRANGGYGTGVRIKSESLNCDVAKYFGRPSFREVVNDPSLFCTAAANPTEQVYFLINSWGFGSFSDNTSISLDVVIEFDIIFWEPRKVAAELRRDGRSPMYMAEKAHKQEIEKMKALGCVVVDNASKRS